MSISRGRVEGVSGTANVACDSTDAVVWMPSTIIGVSCWVWRGGGSGWIAAGCALKAAVELSTGWSVCGSRCGDFDGGGAEVVC